MTLLESLMKDNVFLKNQLIEIEIKLLQAQLEIISLKLGMG